MATNQQFFKPTYAAGENAQYLSDLRASLGQAEVYSTDWGDGTSSPGVPGYKPTAPVHYTPEQAAELYNNMDPRLFEDQQTLLSLFYNGGEVPLQLTPEQIQRQSDRFADNQEGTWFDKLAGAAAIGVGALVTGGALGLWGGAGGVASGAAPGMTAAEAWGTGAGLGGDTLTAMGMEGVGGMTAGEVAASTAGAYTTAAADSALASQTLGSTAADVSAAAAAGALTPAQILQLGKAGLTVASLVGGAQAISNKGGSAPGAGAGGTASQMAEADWREFNDQTLPGLNAQADTIGQRGDAAYEESRGVARGNQKMADQMDADYNSTYRPFQKQQAEYVNRLGSEEYRDQKRGEAVAGVQQQYDNTLDQNTRALQRQGVDPNSGRALAMRNTGTIQAAAAKAGASATAERGAYDDWAKGLDTMSTNGMALQKQALANRDSALSWGKYGLAAGATGLSAGLDVDKARTSKLNTTGGIINSAGSVQNGSRQIDNQQSQYDDSNDLGTAALGYGLKWLTSPKSDAATNASSLWSSLTT